MDQIIEISERRETIPRFRDLRNGRVIFFCEDEATAEKLRNVLNYRMHLGTGRGNVKYNFEELG